MKAERQIPYYAPDGASLGSRTPEAAKRLIAGGYVKPSYGRKGHLRAIWLQSPDGAAPSRHGRRRATSTASSRSWSTGAVGSCASWIAATRRECRSPLATCFCRWWRIVSSVERQGPSRGQAHRPGARRVQLGASGGVQRRQATRQGGRRRRDTGQRGRKGGQPSHESQGPETAWAAAGKPIAD